MAAGEAHIHFPMVCPWVPSIDASVCAALDALRGARVVAIFSNYGIPANALSHHPSLRRLDFFICPMPPLRDLAGYSQLHGLRELVCFEYLEEDDPHQLQHAQPLSQLEVLGVWGMQTVGADATLAALTRLRELNLSHSDLLTLPASMASLRYLTFLDFTGTRVAGGWQHLPLQLEHLDLSIMELPTVPLQLSRLSRLTELSLRGNEQLEGGSEALSHLCSLQKLNLDSCCLGLAVELSPALQLLDISATRLTVVPQVFLQLTAMTSLNMQYNRIASGWQHLAGMQQLETLVLHHCSLTSVPQVFSQLTAMTYLDIRSNPIASGWQHLAGMQQLAHLSVNDCKLAAVPQAFSQLTALTRLDMTSNPIASGWQHLVCIQQLAHLSVTDCKLAAVPQALSQLTALTGLSLRGNAIASGWQHLSLLPLCRLWTDDRAHRIDGA